MKKRNYVLLAASLFFVMLSGELTAQAFNDLDEVPHDISYYRETRITPPLVKVLYGRPSKDEDQKIFGDMVPFGELWRTGYNETTEVRFYKDVDFGGKKVLAGTYALLTIPGETEWKVILNSQLDTWGAFQYDPLFNVAEVIVPVSQAEELKTFSIAFKKKAEQIDMVLGWDATRVKIPLQFSVRNSSLAHRQQR